MTYLNDIRAAAADCVQAYYEGGFTVAETLQLKMADAISRKWGECPMDACDDISAQVELQI
jgi:hypothetical protein